MEVCSSTSLIFMKQYRIKTNDIGMCMSVGCDFYQTCTNNSVNMFYRPKYKFEPIIEDDICLSYGSGNHIVTGKQIGRAHV